MTKKQKIHIMQKALLSTIYIRITNNSKNLSRTDDLPERHCYGYRYMPQKYQQYRTGRIQSHPGNRPTICPVP